jgi:UDP-N-acetylmuramoylalanine--D-glutamate ligase
VLSGKRVIVVGLKKSGIAAARLCQAEGARVLGTDKEARAKLDPELFTLGIEVVAGGHQGVDFSGADLIVVSPGVPALPELVAAEAKGVEVVGELELACRHITAPVVAIGGTNGKSTTTTLIGALAKAAGLCTFVGGNLGTPASNAVGGGHELVVLEVSSFQLERAPRFRPRVSLLLNVTEDHLDRYPDFAAYARAKGNAFVNQTRDDFAIIPEGDSICEGEARRGRARVLRFGESADYAVDANGVLESATGHRFDLRESRLHGLHNYENAAAAIAAVRALQITPEAVRAGLRAFQPLPHRMALAGQVGAVRFYDDSKGTNVGAAVTALLGLAEPRGVLIAGGRDKHGSYTPLVDALSLKGRALVVLGEAAERIALAAAGRLPIAHAKDLDEAVRLAYGLAEPGDAVLLSPACSSFDMFASYADRGEQFVRAVARFQEQTP